jgi:hypothetical protein
MGEDESELRESSHADEPGKRTPEGGPTVNWLKAREAIPYCLLLRQDETKLRRALEDLISAYCIRAEQRRKEALAKGSLLWFNTPNPAFDGRSPKQLLEAGKTAPLLRMLFKLESGEPG